MLSMEITDIVYHPKAEKNLSMLEFKTAQGPHFKPDGYAFHLGFRWCRGWERNLLSADFSYAFN